MAGPDFTMPSAPGPGPVPEAPGPEAPRAVPADRAGTAAAARRMPWRHLAVAGLVGVLVGAALPAGVRAAEQAAADADAERLRSTAMAYLTAIAAGEAAVATAMVPAPGAAPNDVLRAAAPITAPEVGLVTVAGDAATVEVRFELGERQITRTLWAARDGGLWRLGTTLAEPVAVTRDVRGSGVRVGGVALEPDPPALLYPGRYRIDVAESGLLRTGGDLFEVDGDPATLTEAVARSTPTEELASAAVPVARARVGACQLLAECPVDVATVARPGDAILVSGVDPASGAIDLLLPLGLGSGFGGNGQELRLRALVDAAGALVGWQCSEAGAPDGPLEPCAP